MTTFVTVNTSATASVLVPFTSAANAALAQAALDAGPNSVASIGGGIFKYFSPTVGGNATPPGVSFLGGIVQTISGATSYGVIPATYQDLVNAGHGTAIGVGGANASLWSGQNATTVFLNSNASGQAFLGGGNDVVANAFSFGTMNVLMDSPANGALGGSTLTLDEHNGGSSTVQAQANDLISVLTGGSDLIVVNSGTVVVFSSHGSSTLNGAATVTGVAGATEWVAQDNAPIFITPGASNAFVFSGKTGFADAAVTLFGGTQVIAGQTLTAPAYTGQTTVIGMNGYLQSGSAGGSVMTSGTTNSAATLVAGGAGDIMFLNAQGDTADLGNGAGVFGVTVTQAGGNIGNTFKLGSGTGEAIGGQRGHNTFLFQGAGVYTIAGFHDTDLTGSLYKDAATGTGGAGNITIADFFPQQIQTVTVAASLGGHRRRPCFAISFKQLARRLRDESDPREGRRRQDSCGRICSWWSRSSHAFY